jgi:hypothetical protein
MIAKVEATQMFLPRHTHTHRDVHAFILIPSDAFMPTEDTCHPDACHVTGRLQYRTSVHLCMFRCIGEREGGREGGKERESDGESEGERERECHVTAYKHFDEQGGDGNISEDEFVQFWENYSFA